MGNVGRYRDLCRNDRGHFRGYVRTRVRVGEPERFVLMGGRTSRSAAARIGSWMARRSDTSYEYSEEGYFLYGEKPPEVLTVAVPWDLRRGEAATRQLSIRFDGGRPIAVPDRQLDPPHPGYDLTLLRSKLLIHGWSSAGWGRGYSSTQSSRPGMLSPTPRSSPRAMRL